MTLYLLKIGKWLLGKSAVLIVATLVAIGVFALYLYIGDSFRLDRERLEKLEATQALARQTYQQLESIHSEIIDVAKELDDARTKAQTAQQLIEKLEGFLSKIEYLFSSAAEKKAVDDQLASAKVENEQLGAQIIDLRTRHAGLRVTRTSLSDEAQKLEEEILALETGSSEIVRYINASWSAIRVYLPIAIAVIVLGPIVLKLTAYYVIAPIFQWAKPIQFSRSKLAEPAILDSGVSVGLSLVEGETAWIKESYLQASDENLDRRTRFVLNWQIPVTCLAAGLVELIEFTSKSDGKVTASTQDKPDMELCLLRVPEKSSIILRPSHLVGLIAPEGEMVSIRRRWSFARAQAWMTLQFRYFEFVGPCRLVVSGVRGVRAESIDSGPDGGRRANQDSTIGFTPDLQFGATRAETFWAYFRGFNPLFDDVFRGHGVFLCQEITRGEDSGPTRFWAGMRDAFLKVVGI